MRHKKQSTRKPRGCGVRLSCTGPLPHATSTPSPLATPPPHPPSPFLVHLRLSNCKRTTSPRQPTALTARTANARRELTRRVQTPLPLFLVLSAGCWPGEAKKRKHPFEAAAAPKEKRAYTRVREPSRASGRYNRGRPWFQAQLPRHGNYCY